MEARKKPTQLDQIVSKEQAAQLAALLKDFIGEKREENKFLCLVLDICQTAHNTDVLSRPFDSTNTSDGVTKYREELIKGVADSLRKKFEKGQLGTDFSEDNIQLFVEHIAQDEAFIRLENQIEAFWKEKGAESGYSKEDQEQITRLLMGGFMFQAGAQFRGDPENKARNEIIKFFSKQYGSDDLYRDVIANVLANHSITSPRQIIINYCKGSEEIKTGDTVIKRKVPYKDQEALEGLFTSECNALFNDAKFKRLPAEEQLRFVSDLIPAAKAAVEERGEPKKSGFSLFSSSTDSDLLYKLIDKHLQKRFDQLFKEVRKERIESDIAAGGSEGVTTVKGVIKHVKKRLGRN